MKRGVCDRTVTVALRPHFLPGKMRYYSTYPPASFVGSKEITWKNVLKA